MPAGYSDWPGAREAEPGETYSRDGPDGANIFHVDEVDDEGRVILSGRWDTA